MIDSVSQVGSKVTACCHFMEPIKTLLPSMLAAGANRKIALVGIFLKLIVQYQRFFFTSFFLTLLSYLLSPPPSPLQKRSFDYLTFNSFNV